MKLKQAKDETIIKKIKDLYEYSFPKEEKKPFSLICEKQKTKQVEILSLEKENNFYGLMILALYNDYILLDYFAIDVKYQSKGIGSEAIKLLFKKYKNKKIIIEIESTLKLSNNQLQREKRKNFYLKNNFKILPFKVNLFNVEMEILSNNTNINYEEYIKIYENTYGKNISKNIFLIEK